MKENKYLKGILGALAGAIIGTIIFILISIMVSSIFTLLAILTVVGGFYGYKLTKAKIDKKLPIIIAIISFICITIAVLVIIPMGLLLNQGTQLSMDNLMALYQVNDNREIIFNSYAMSLLAGLIVVVVIIVNLNKQLKNNVAQEQIKIIAPDASNKVFSNEDINQVKKLFEEKNALDKKGAIEKEVILPKINTVLGIEKGKAIFEYLRTERIIKKSKKKFYFSVKAQNSPWYRYGFTNFKTVLIILAIAVVLSAIQIAIQERNNQEAINEFIATHSEKTYELPGNNIMLKVPEDMYIVPKDEISTYWRKEYAEVYDCIALSLDFERMAIVSQVDKEDYTPEEYLKEGLKDENIEIEEQTIEDNLFYVTRTSYTGQNNQTYEVLNCLYEVEDKFVCIAIDFNSTEKMELENIILPIE